MALVLDQGVRLELDLHFQEPFPAQNHLRFDLDPESGGRACVVSWTVTGAPTGLMRTLARVLPMDRLVGTELQKGLRRLKAQVESEQAGAC